MTDPKKPEETESEKPEQKSAAMVTLHRRRWTDHLQTEFPRGGRTIAMVSLLVALVAGAGALYMWKELLLTRTNTVLGQDELSDRLGNLESANSRRLAELEQARQGSEDAVRRSEAVKQTVDELRTRVTRDRDDWLLAETQFLLNAANSKLRLDSDVGSAIAGLEEADRRLQVLNDPSLVPVRTAISRDLQALRAVPVVDRTGVALQLGTLIKATGELPLTQGLAVPSSNAARKAERPPVTGVGSFFNAVWHDIKGLVTVRHLEHPVMPMLPPDQRLFLRENLALKLETARVALLLREPAVFKASITEARRWMERYYDASKPAVRSALDDLGKLQAMEIAPPLPDISDSLRQLRRSKRQVEPPAEKKG